MIVANIHSAKTNLSKLIEAVEAGEEVVIARNGKPVARLAPLREAERPPRRADGLPAWMGSLAGELRVGEGFDEYDSEIAAAFDDAVNGS